MNSVVLDSGNPKEQNTKTKPVQKCREKLSKHSEVSDADCAVICLRKQRKKKWWIYNNLKGKRIREKRGASDAGKMIFDQKDPVVVVFGFITMFWKARMHTDILLRFRKSIPLLKRLLHYYNMTKKLACRHFEHLPWSTVTVVDSVALQGNHRSPIKFQLV